MQSCPYVSDPVVCMCACWWHAGWRQTCGSPGRVASHGGHSQTGTLHLKTHITSITSAYQYIGLHGLVRMPICGPLVRAVSISTRCVCVCMCPAGRCSEWLRVGHRASVWASGGADTERACGRYGVRLARTRVAGWGHAASTGARTVRRRRPAHTCCHAACKPMQHRKSAAVHWRLVHACMSGHCVFMQGLEFVACSLCGCVWVCVCVGVCVQEAPPQAWRSRSALPCIPPRIRHRVPRSPSRAEDTMGKHRWRGPDPCHVTSDRHTPPSNPPHPNTSLHHQRTHRQHRLGKGVSSNGTQGCSGRTVAGHLRAGRPIVRPRVAL